MSEEIVKILLIEDDEDDYLITRDLLEEIKGTHFVLDWVTTCKAAQEIINQNNHDIYLVDYRLGEGNGLEVIKENVAKGNPSPFILLTGQNDDDIDRGAMKVGVADYLIKNELTASMLERSMRYSLDRSRRLLALKHRDKQILYLAAIVESSSDAIFSKSMDDAIITWNKGAEKMYGYSPDEIIGKPFSTLIAREDADRISGFFGRDLSKDDKNYEVMCIKKDGSKIFVSLAKSLIEDSSSNIIGTSIIARDITERKVVEKALKESEARLQNQTRILQSILHCMADGVVVADTFGNFILSNPAAEQLLGKNVKPTTIEEWSKHFSCFLPDETTLYPTDEIPLVKAIRGESIDEVEVFIRNESKPDGILLSFTARPLKEPSGLLLGGVVVFHDITERKKAQKELLEERAMLARRIEERTADLSLTNAELARANRMKDEFLASMSHELRTPLNAIIGLSEALIEGVYGNLEENQLSSLQIVESSGRHLLSLINDILDLSKVEAGKLDLSLDWVYVESVCQASLAFIKQTASKKSLKVSFTLDSQINKIWADERRLKQILVNLLSNAVKFTPDGGSIGLEVIGEVKEQIAKFIVWDTGIGIKEKDLERIFQPFVQIDSALSRKHSGTGLGLTLISRMIDLHGGNISIESEVGKGSRFIMSLPWQEHQEKLINPSLVINDSQQKVEFIKTIKTALIIEDSPSTVEQLTRYFKDLRIETVICTGDKDLMETIHNINPDIILLDILLPNISGWQILGKIKSNTNTNKIPVFIISVIDEKRKAEELGAVGYLVKPIAREHLQTALAKICPSISLPINNSLPIALEIDTLQTNLTNTKQQLILLAEDNESNIKTFSDYLHMKGYKVIVARNGVEAITQARKNKPNLILMDIQMPGMDGLEATRCIRSDISMANIPIIALTALAMPHDRNLCLQAGVNEYLSKPISLKNLVEIIEQQLSAITHN